MLISLPRSLNAEMISDCESLKTFQHVSFELPLNLLVWSQPVNAWNPSKAALFSDLNASKALPISMDRLAFTLINTFSCLEID